MASERLYVPSTLSRLSEAVAAGGIGPGPFLAHAVTEELRTQDPDGSEEDWEYAALSAAALSSIGLLGDQDVQRRVVIVADGKATLRTGGYPMEVEVTEVLPMKNVAAVHVDTEDAVADVQAARSRYAAALDGDPAAVSVVERCMDHELAWFATQEIRDLLALHR